MLQRITLPPIPKPTFVRKPWHFNSSSSDNLGLGDPFTMTHRPLNRRAKPGSFPSLLHTILSAVGLKSRYDRMNSFTRVVH
jgi:hypothetical protein